MRYKFEKTCEETDSNKKSVKINPRIQNLRGKITHDSKNDRTKELPS